MKKVILLVLLFLFVFYCFYNKSYISSPNNESLIIIINKGSLTKDELTSVKDRIEESFSYITTNTFQSIKQPKIIKIYLYKDDKRSYAVNSQVHLYAFPKYDYVIAHELVHVILGSNKHFHMLLEEGVAEYVQKEVGNETNQNYDIAFHKHVKAFIDYGKVIPLQKLLDDDFLKIVTNPQDGNPKDKNYEQTFRIWMYYTQAASFVTYLIEEYGWEKLERCFYEDNLHAAFLTNYNKPLEQLESDWHHYLQNDVLSYSTQELNHPIVRNINYYLPRIE